MASKKREDPCEAEKTQPERDRNADAGGKNRGIGQGNCWWQPRSEKINRIITLAGLSWLGDGLNNQCSPPISARVRILSPTSVSRERIGVLLIMFPDSPARLALPLLWGLCTTSTLNAYVPCPAWQSISSSPFATNLSVRVRGTEGTSHYTILIPLRLT